MSTQHCPSASDQPQKFQRCSGHVGVDTEAAWGFTVADLGFHEGGFVRLGENLQTTPFYVVERYPRC